MKKRIKSGYRLHRDETNEDPLKYIAAIKDSFDTFPKQKRVVCSFFLLLLYCLLCHGCISLYYAPNSQNVPMFTRKNETESSLAFQFGTLTYGCDASLAYSVSNHIGLIANYNHWGAKKKSMLPNSDVEFHITGKSDFFEAGAGYFLPFQEKFVFEVYGGMGQGNVRNIYENRSESKMNFNRYFIQPSCGYYNRIVNLAFSLRLSEVDYRKFSFDPQLETGDKLDIEYIMDEPFALYLEPAFTFRVGGENLKFQLQVELSDNLNSPDLVYEPLCITVGLLAVFPNKKVKKESPVEK